MLTQPHFANRLRRRRGPWLTILLLLLPAGCTAAQQTASATMRSCTIHRISDGDSFRCTDGRRVRLIGIDSPELQQRPFGPQAQQALLLMLPLGATVRLETDASQLDRYGRELAYVWTGDTLVNEAMVRHGWAVIYTVPPNVKYAERLARAQKEARADHAGLWAQQGFGCLPSDFRQRRCVSPP